MDAEIPAWARTFSTDSQSFWRPRSVIELARPRLAPGAYAVSLRTASPCYATLRLTPEHDELAPIGFSLDPFAPCAYRKLFSIRDAARSIELTLEPAVAPSAVLSLGIETLGPARLAACGMRKIVEHLATPASLVRKARQVLSGAGNLVFSPAGDHHSPAENYESWRTAFESAEERSRLLAALEPWRGRKELTALAVVPATGPDARELIETGLSLATTAGPCRVRYLLIGSSDQPLPPSAREGLARLGSALVELPDPALPLGAILEHAVAASAGAILFIDRPGRFHGLAVASLLFELAANPDAAAVYADSDRLDAGGERCDPDFKPAWSPDYLTDTDYIGAPVAFRADPRSLGGADLGFPACASCELLLRLAARPEPGLVRHVPRVLFHERERSAGLTASQCAAADAWADAHGVGVERTGSGRQRVRRLRYSLPSPAPLASVIIPSRDNAPLLGRAIRSVQSARYPRTEIVVVDNGSTSAGQRTLLDGLVRRGDAKVVVVSDPQPFNFPRLINAGRRAATGDVLILLNDDVESIDDGWLEELVAQSVRPGIGCVGALLLYPTQRIQHAGIILGINGGPGHAFRHTAFDAEAADSRLRVVREVAAVTGACLAVRAGVFDQAGGFDETLPITMNDVDFCLRVAALGHRHIVTPYARLIHRESSSRGLDSSRAKLGRLQRETAIFLRRWGTAAVEDPYLNPHLSRSHEDYRMREL